MLRRHVSWFQSYLTCLIKNAVLSSFRYSKQQKYQSHILVELLSFLLRTMDAETARCAFNCGEKCWKLNLIVFNKGFWGIWIWRADKILRSDTISNPNPAVQLRAVLTSVSTVQQHQRSSAALQESAQAFQGLCCSQVDLIQQDPVALLHCLSQSSLRRTTTRTYSIKAQNTARTLLYRNCLAKTAFIWQSATSTSLDNIFFALSALPPQTRKPWLSHRLGSAAESGSAWAPAPPNAPAARQLHKHTGDVSLSLHYSTTILLTLVPLYHLTPPAAPWWEQTCRRGPWVWADPASASPWSRSAHGPGKSGSASASTSARTGPQRPPAGGARSACGRQACTCIRQRI